MDNKKHISVYRSMLEDYFSGTVDGELAERIRSWIPDGGDSDEIDRILRRQFEKFVAECSKPNRSTEEAWKKISAELSLIQKRDRKFFKISLNRRWMTVAAVVIPLLIVGGTYIWFRLQPEKTAEPLMAVVNYSAELSAPEDGKKRARLPDGTEVILNAGAALAYDAAGYSSARNVRLNGEAYFSVANDGGAPFVVDAGDLTVTVLGTEFNVKTGESGGYSEVSLFSGSVEVRTKDKTTLLQPNQQALIEKDTGVTMVKEFDRDAVGGWRMRLDLDNVSLPEALTLIENHFGVPVSVEGSLPVGNRIRVSFKEPTIDETMDIIQMITRGFDFRIETDTVRVSVKK